MKGYMVPQQGLPLTSIYGVEYSSEYPSQYSVTRGRPGVHVITKIDDFPQIKFSTFKLLIRSFCRLIYFFSVSEIT